eukprot:SAG11_NODE_323_length_10745_cov_18.203926_3_plen_193_part_00
MGCGASSLSEPTPRTSIKAVTEPRSSAGAVPVGPEDATAPEPRLRRGALELPNASSRVMTGTKGRKKKDRDWSNERLGADIEVLNAADGTLAAGRINTKASLRKTKAAGLDGVADDDEPTQEGVLFELEEALRTGELKRLAAAIKVGEDTDFVEPDALNFAQEFYDKRAAQAEVSFQRLSPVLRQTLGALGF